MRFHIPRISLKNYDNIFYLKVFLSILGFLVFCALLFRITLLIQESQYTTSSFRILVLAHDAYIVNINRDTGELSVGIYKNRGHTLAANTKLKNSLLLHAPIDGEIIQSNNDAYPQFARQYFSFMNMMHILFSHDTAYRGINVADVIKIFFAAKGIPSNQINQEILTDSTPQDDIYNLFKDTTVINEKTSIQIINATDINGLGTQTSQMLENAGFDVVSIDSQDMSPKSKIIYRISPNVSLAHLLKIFPYSASYKAEDAIADITIILGKDAGVE